MITEQEIDVENKSSVIEEFSYRNCIIKFVASAWNGNKRDDDETRNTAERNKVEGKRLSVRKYLLASDELNEVISAIQSARNYLNSKSLPWQNDGERIIPSTQVLDLRADMSDKIREIYTKVDALIVALPKLIENDRVKLGDLFDITEYPTADQLKSKFAAKILVLPLSTNFIVQGIDSAHKKVIQKEIDEQIENAVKETKIFQLTELSESISHLAGRLNDYKGGRKGAFKGNSIQKIIDNAANIQNISIEEDDKMLQLSRDIKQDFSKLDADKLRENNEDRKSAVDMANKRLKEINEIMQNFV